MHRSLLSGCLGEGRTDELANASQISMETDDWERKLSLTRGLTNNKQFSLVLSRRVLLLCGGSCRLVCVYGCRMVALELSGTLDH